MYTLELLAQIVHTVQALDKMVAAIQEQVLAVVPAQAVAQPISVLLLVIGQKDYQAVSLLLLAVAAVVCIAAVATVVPWLAVTPIDSLEGPKQKPEIVVDLASVVHLRLMAAVAAAAGTAAAHPAEAVLAMSVMTLAEAEALRTCLVSPVVK